MSIQWPISRTTWVSWYQKKFFNEARDNGTKNKDQNHHRLFGMAAMHAKCTQLQ